MHQYKIRNTMVITAAIAAVITTIAANTDWLKKNTGEITMRERCYGIARVEKNDCATSIHSCASQAKINRSSDEFLMLPKGLCERIIGGKVGG